MKVQKKWYDYLWIASLFYLILGFFHILFAWLGMICFLVPLFFAIRKGNKAYCNFYCGRSQLFDLLGKKLHLSAQRDTPKWMRSKYFRYGFLVFFMIMFFNMLFSTYLVFSGKQNLREVVTLLWSFRIPWQFANSSLSIPFWIQQFAFGFYSIMLTSTILGIITMVFFKPRSWCVYCPMGTMTQAICKMKNHNQKQQNNPSNINRLPVSNKKDK